MRTQHTQGEWKLDREDRNYGACIKNEEGVLICALSDRLENKRLEDDEIEMIFNGKIIAAAPELLEAAKFAIQICKGSMDPAATDCSLKLKAAIQKATQP